MENTREIVLDTLLAIESGQGYSHKVIKDVLDKYDYLGGQEKAFIKRLTEGTLERRIEIDYVLNGISSVPVKKMKPLIRSLLRMGLYQIMYMDGVPDSAACNEAVKLAEKRRFHNLKGFVNGVLRKAAKQKESICYPDPVKAPMEYLSVKYSMPEWIVRKWTEEYGGELTERMLNSLLQTRGVTIRIASFVPEEERTRILEALRERGTTVDRHPYLSCAYVLTGTDTIRTLPGYAEGYLTVQDVSSMLAVAAADIKEGDLVLDICAAPGGKAMLAAEAAGSGAVEARDVSAYKVSLMEENIRRMKLANINVRQWDALVPDEEMTGKADVVLADVPCSGLGVIGKKRDIKYNVTPESIEEITVLQREILLRAAAYVKSGGILLYSTCTLNKEENEAMVQWICDTLPFLAENMDPYLPACLHSETTAKGYLQLYPGIHDTDGFFFARLRRTDGDGNNDGRK